jgi:hypothetical protein
MCHVRRRVVTLRMTQSLLSAWTGIRSIRVSSTTVDTVNSSVDCSFIFSLSFARTIVEQLQTSIICLVEGNIDCRARSFDLPHEREHRLVGRSIDEQRASSVKHTHTHTHNRTDVNRCAQRTRDPVQRCRWRSQFESMALHCDILENIY